MQNYSILYGSKTGNTKILAEEIQNILPKDKCEYFGEININETQGDTIFVGFWTDRGSCSEDIKTYLSNLKNKKIFLFGTAGFGEDRSYFEKIINNVSTTVDTSSKIIGSYMCQGKMPISVREKYESMIKENSLKAQNLIDNFEKAARHPNNADISNLTKVIENILNITE